MGSIMKYAVSLPHILKRFDRHFQAETTRSHVIYAEDLPEICTREVKSTSTKSFHQEILRSVIRTKFTRAVVLETVGMSATSRYIFGLFVIKAGVRILASHTSELRGPQSLPLYDGPTFGSYFL